MGTGPFGLEDNDFWTNPWKTLNDVAWDRVGENEGGIIIDAPDLVDIDAQNTLPLISYYTAELTQLKYFPYEGNALVVVMDLDNNQLLATKVPPVDRVVSSKGEPGPGFGGSEYIMDLRKSSGLEWSPCNCLVTVVMRDLVSNRKPFSLNRSPVAYRDPEVEKLIALGKQKKPPRKIMPFLDNDSIKFEKSEKSPDLSKEEGITLQLERVVVRKENAANVLHASLRIAIPAHDVVRTIEGQEAPDVGDEKAKAVIGVSVVIIGSEESDPTILTMAIPSYDEIEGTSERPIATGYFALDLFKITRIADREQTYFIYAFAGSEMEGPLLNAVVAKESLQ